MGENSLNQQTVRLWLEQLLSKEDFSQSPMALSDSRAWRVEAGAFRHRSGRFFNVVGIHAVTQDGLLVQQPMLEQREIGNLALIVRRGDDGMEILVQAKAEPGNVGTFQLAPSCQATASNTARVHGGVPPPMVEWFGEVKRGELVADSLQSEQGTRFLGKRNRNCTLLITEQLIPGPYHAWLPVRALCALLGSDHLLNTDLRSTLLCSDWDLLSSGTPFAGAGFARTLSISNQLADAAAWEPLSDILTALQRPAHWHSAPEVVPLSSLQGWRLSEEGIEPIAGYPFRVRHIQVRSRSREVAAWDQPIVDSAGVGEVWLPMAEWEGAPHFLFRIVAEPGFGARMELTPAIIVEPGARAQHGAFEASLMHSGRVLISCFQSEEGGRFLMDENHYVIIDVGTVTTPPEDCHWLSLAQIRALLRRGESLTNEARSVLSLLLKWL